MTETAVTKKMVKAFQNKYREFFPGSWPDTETSGELLSAALSAGQDCKRKDELLTAAVDDYNDARSLAIDECLSIVADYAGKHSAIAAAIRRLKPTEAEGRTTE